jgi:hypothetical protein
VRARPLPWLCALGLVTGFARAAVAEQRLSLELQGCGALSESALREHLALELATLGLADSALALRLRCDASTVVVELAEGARRYPVQARVELADTEPGARERLVALAASELVAQADRARRSDAQPAPAKPATTSRLSAPHPPLTSHAARRSSAARGSRVELSAAASAATQGEPKATLWGAALGARFALGRRWSFVADTRYERGQKSLTLAGVSWASLSGFAGAALSANAGAVQLSAGLGLRAGWLSLSAAAVAPNEGAGLTAPWAGVALPLRVALSLGGPVRPFAGVEAGYVTLPVRGNVDDGSALVEQRGGWLLCSLGVAVAL